MSQQVEVTLAGTEMEPVTHSILQFVHGDKWPSNLVSLHTAASDLGLDENRLRELTDAGYAPHWRIDGGEPLYRLTDLRAWGARNLAACCAGRPLPVQLSINVLPLPCNNAPEPIRDIPRLVELPIAAQPGIYFLCREGKVVYVGQSVSPLSRIGTHGLERRKDYDHAFMVPVPSSSLDAVERALIRWLKPQYNDSDLRRFGKEDGDTEIMETVLGFTPARIQRPEHAPLSFYR